MGMAVLDLPNGYYDLPAGKLVNVVTCLEMSQKPAAEAKNFPLGYNLRKVDPNDLESYRQVYRDVGEDNMWFSRLIMSDQKLTDILSHPEVECYTLFHNENAIGVLELNFRDLPNCEVAFFGVVKTAIGTGIGRCLMDAALAKAWAKPITRCWLHTCNLDHPNALRFYQKSGFKAFKLQIEVHDDPRVQGKMSRLASPQVALIDPP